VHTWPLATTESEGDSWESYETVGQLMTTEVFTVHAEDLVDLAASVMEWERVRHIPVEDKDGRLVGILSHRDLLKLVARGTAAQKRDGAALTVGDIMVTGLVTVSPETPTLDAIRAMRKHHVGCLPVV